MLRRRGEVSSPWPGRGPPGAQLYLDAASRSGAKTAVIAWHAHTGRPGPRPARGPPSLAVNHIYGLQTARPAPPGSPRPGKKGEARPAGRGSVGDIEGDTRVVYRPRPAPPHRGQGAEAASQRAAAPPVYGGVRTMTKEPGALRAIKSDILRGPCNFGLRTTSYVGSGKGRILVRGGKAVTPCRRARTIEASRHSWASGAAEAPLSSLPSAAWHRLASRLLQSRPARWDGDGPTRPG